MLDISWLRRPHVLWRARTGGLAEAFVTNRTEKRRRHDDAIVRHSAGAWLIRQIELDGDAFDGHAKRAHMHGMHKVSKRLAQ